MIKIPGRTIDQYGTVIFNEDGLVQLLFQEDSIDMLTVEPEIAKDFNRICRRFDLDEHQLVPYSKQTMPIEEHDKHYQNHWLVPERFMKLDIERMVLGMCQTKEQIERVKLELELYKKLELIDILRVMVYLVYVMRTNGIVWGVGRGSSVASYILFLLGVHKVDSLKYNLDIKEFLKG
jgi:DNA polymerase III alpha subunit